MHTSKGLAFVLTLFALSGAAGGFAACGGSNGVQANGSDDGSADGTTAADGSGDATSDDGSQDGTVGNDGSNTDGSGSTDGNGSSDGNGSGDGGGMTDGGGPSDANQLPDGFFGGDGSTCITLGSGCTSNGECCTGYCSGNICSAPPCVSIGGACTSGSQCCSFTCGGNGTCAQIGGNSCLPLGNSCSASADCCSGNCTLGTCQPSSWCGQTGDICQNDSNCCSGSCNVPSGASVGTCNAPTFGGNCTAVDGQLCTAASFVDGGCGGSCCSRLCAPWGPTGVMVCQPATGCHVEGDTCTTDSECCGSQALLDAGAYGVPTSGHTVVCMNGYCQQHMGCTPNGDVCKLQSTSCNANQDCCAGLGNSKTACRQDNVGVPRCASGCDPDAGMGVPGGACATSADCCNGDPCVPNPDGGSPPYVCANTQCVPSCSTCSTTADCCPGYSCINGTCDPCGGGTNDGGTTSGDGGTTSGDGGTTSGDGGTTSGDAGTGSDSGPLSCSQAGQLCGDAGLPCCTGLICLSTTTGDRCELP